MSTIKSNTKQKITHDKSNLTKPRRFYWSQKTHSIQPFEVLVNEVAA